VRHGARCLSLTGIGGSGALPLMDCILLARGELPVPSDFTVTVTDAADVNVVPIVPLPEVRISRIAAEGGDASVAR
jgi:hypothetical protein